MTIKECFKPKSSKDSSSKTAKFYNEEKNRCIADLACHNNPEVRSAIATNSHTPTKVLAAMLEIEQDKNVLRKVLMNSKLPRKAVAKFVGDEVDRRVDWFSNDVELIKHFTQE